MQTTWLGSSESHKSLKLPQGKNFDLLYFERLESKYDRLGAGAVYRYPDLVN